MGQELSLKIQSVIVLLVKLGLFHIARIISRGITGIVMGVIKGMLLLGLQRSAILLQKMITIESSAVLGVRSVGAVIILTRGIVLWLQI